MHILLVEDEPKITNLIKRSLKERQFAVDVAENIEEAFYLAENIPYDLIILDLVLPDGDGVSMCRNLRTKKNNTPILMLTARNSVKDRVTGLNAGADDYLGKPFSFTEFLARIYTLLRRQRQEKTDTLKVSDLELNMLTHDVKRGNEPILLTSKEYALLEYLMLNANHVVTRTMISEHVWNEEFNAFSNVIDVHIRYLRRKLNTKDKVPLIQTIRGTGYILKCPHE